MKKIMGYKLFTLLLFSLFCNPLYAQDLLSEYIQQGLENNIVIKQRKISFERAEYSLKVATSYFYPSISFGGSYTSGEGGRSISIPVGDLLNPVYQTLNQLTGTNDFPQINNVNESFFPNKFYDLKIQAAMPIINTDLIFNRQVQDHQVQIQEFEIELYKKELTKEIRIAYFNYLSALASIKIFESALEVALEGKRVNESLLKNDTGLKAYVLRSEGEVENIKAQQTDAKNQTENAKRYFNFLLNRNLDADINSDFNVDEKISYINSLVNYKTDVEQREELKMLEQGIEINKSLLSMNKYFWIPKVNAFVDLGAQDKDWNYGKDSRYYLYGVQLSVPIFEAFRNQYKISQSELDVEESELNYELTNNQLQLSIKSVLNNLYAAKQNYTSSQKQLEAAKSYYNLINKGYIEGLNSFIETVDARTQLTRSELLVNINKYKILIAEAQYRREVASE